MTKEEHKKALKLIERIEGLQDAINDVKEHKAEIKEQKTNVDKLIRYCFRADCLSDEIFDLYVFNIHAKIIKTQEELRQLEQQIEA